ncbi:MAG: type 4a pilus biogenesis protein PilO [Gammaproteobacteria bacterium]|nr:type 4a pilus biogenesis protein PilO [Gammaproteobacteria bacterium]MBU2056333.1 type 4a pilus biogenesis protein PilO [Gammaproteobacteria bacterium]MBU2177226.1 type 4a pilus biogenesis protein PilO [Gammaproteobacteria bacterium]MBU2246128.1 type 4a pilus biogenesis protein PilO [Gammaproteobacteria bacterium]MBU2344752.1 type 4a pilus biogenesis protein PilO [Gammaproteobacteria bacterium]
MSLNINLSDIDLSEIDFNDMGAWPKAGKIALALVVAFSVMLLSYFFLIETQVTNLEAAQQKELELRLDYQSKYGKAINLELYQEQMLEMEKTFSTLLKQLPATHETPGMLDDITFAGTSVGLTFVRINWMPEIEKEFYTELPIQIEVIGDYHQIGNFVSEIAKLPRIVSLHDFVIQSREDGQQSFSVIAKTYRYKELKK